VSLTARSSYDSGLVLRAVSIRLAGAVIVIVAVGIVYHQAALSYFFNDDFQWLQRAREFRAANLLDLARYDHFYRPIIEIYFYLGQRLFGCTAWPFHAMSVAIHFTNTLLLFLFARALFRSGFVAFLTAMFFCVQPAYVEAVAWVGAITDLLPACWYLLALWTHLLFLERGGVRFYAASVAAFAACLLTHESSATLLPMMIALEATLASERRLPALSEVEGPGPRQSASERAARYAPLALLLVGYLALAYVVNSRSYLIREGHYALGWHAVPHVLEYIVSLYVGQRTVVTYVLIGIVTGLLLWRGTPRMRFAVLWIFMTLAPVAFFTWGNASRYTYMPAAGFALLLAEMLAACESVVAAWWTPKAARAGTLVLASAIAVRYGLFAKKEADIFRERTRPYERLVAAIGSANSSHASAGIVYVDREDAEAVPALYLDSAARTARCAGDVRVVIR